MRLKRRDRNPGVCGSTETEWSIVSTVNERGSKDKDQKMPAV